MTWVRAFSLSSVLLLVIASSFAVLAGLIYLLEYIGVSFHVSLILSLLVCLSVYNKIITTITKSYDKLDPIKWLEEHQGVCLISDDDGHWAVSDTGMGPIPPVEEEAEFICNVDPDYWFPTIQEAVEYAASKWE